MSDIVERLRNRFHGIEQLRDPAADTIEALRAKVEGLSKERAECYGTIGALVQERDRLLRGEFICKRCGLRKDSEQSTDHEF